MPPPRVGDLILGRGLGSAAGLLLLIALVALAPAKARAACVPVVPPFACEQLCDGGATAGTCTISGCLRIFGSGTFDCSGRDVVVSGAAKVQIEDGLVAIHARDFVLGPAGDSRARRTRIEARQRRDRTSAFGLMLELSGDLELNGLLSARASRGTSGTVEVIADGDVTLGGTSRKAAIDVSARRAGLPGGTARLRSGGTITVGRAILANAKRTKAALGGTVELFAAGDVVVADVVSAQGAGFPEGHASGGDVAIEAGGMVTLAGQIDVRGFGRFGAGGEVQIAGTAVEVAAGSSSAPALRVAGNGGERSAGGTAPGGQLRIDAGAGGVTIGEYTAMELRGGPGGAGQLAGTVTIESQADLTVGKGAEIRVPVLDEAGEGGSITLRAAGTLRLGELSRVDARTRPTGPAGPPGVGILLSACEIDAARRAALNTHGAVASPITLIAGRRLSFDGTLKTRGGNPSRDAEVDFVFGAEGTCAGDPTRTCADDAACAGGICELNPVIGPDAKLNRTPPVPIFDPSVSLCD